MLSGGLIVIIFLLFVFIFQVQLPLTAEAVLEAPTMPILLFSLAAFGEFLLMPGGLALYFALKDVNRNQVFLGTALWLTAIPMFLVSRGITISIITISGSYTDTTDTALRAAYLAAAQLALGISNVFAVMSLMLLGVGSIVLGFVMLKGVFSKRTAQLVILAGALIVMGTFGVILQPLTIGTLFGLILSGVWQVLLGIRLFKLGSDIL